MIVTVTAVVAGGTPSTADNPQTATVVIGYAQNNPRNTADANDDGDDTTTDIPDVPSDFNPPDITVSLDTSGDGSNISIFQFDPVTDADLDDEVIVLSGSWTDQNNEAQTDTAEITVTDVDPGVATVTITASPTSFADGDGDQNVVVNATITMEAAMTADATVTVTIRDATPAGTDDNNNTNDPKGYDPDVHAETGDYSFPSDQTIQLTVRQGETGTSGSRIVVIDKNADAGSDSADEKILVEAEAGGKNSNQVTLTMTDTDVGVKSLALFCRSDIPT